MTQEEAQQIADLLNLQNKLAVQYDASDILADANNYILLKKGKTVIACVNLKRVQWYQIELNHLSVLPSEKGKGLAQKLIEKSEVVARKKGAHVLQCTIRDSNTASKNLFKKNGFAPTNQFHNHRTNNIVSIWQKVIVGNQSN